MIDTAKAANLYVAHTGDQTVLDADRVDLSSLSFSVYRDAPLLDFINAPVGKGLPVKLSLKPLIASTSV